MEKVMEKEVFKKYDVQIDPGTSQWKTSIRTGANTFEIEEFPAMFLRSDETFVGLDNFFLESPPAYAGLVGDPVQDHNPTPYARNAHFFTSDEFRLGIFYAVSRLLDKVHAPEMCEIRLVLAYPANYLHEIESLRGGEFMGNYWAVKSGHGGRTVFFSIVEAVQQGAAVVYGAGLRWNSVGQLTDFGFRRLMPQGKILVGCFGSNSCEWSLFSGSFRTMTARSVFFGLLEMVGDLQQLLRRDFGVDLSEAETVNVMRTSTFQGHDLTDTLSSLVEAYLDQPKFKSDIDKCLADIGFQGSTRGSVILAGGVLLRGYEPILEIFRASGREPEFAYNEKAETDSLRLAVLDGLQKYHVSKKES